MSDELRHAVDALTKNAVTLSDTALASRWELTTGAGTKWSGYAGTTREIFFQAYQELRELAVDVLAERSRSATPLTAAQIILGQHHRAYRDLTGALAGVREDEFDVAPDENEWPLRTVIFHMMLTERGFFTRIHWAVDRQRSGDTRSLEMPDSEVETIGGSVSEEGTLAEMMAHFDDLHGRVLTNFADLTDDDLNAPSLWWEGHELPVRFRLHRFDAHLREHTIQVDKTLAGINHPSTEAERLTRLLHRALGEYEAASIGTTDMAADQQHAVAVAISDMASEIAQMHANR